MDKSTREKILEFINAHPGTHLREIQRKLKLGLKTVQYHLYTLEKEGKIVSRRKGLYKRFYPTFLVKRNAKFWVCYHKNKKGEFCYI
ncbi:hypothetical protein B9P99_00755 [Candidatus Marsarchaeota G1 archaeon OSP_B]|uniref:HVO-0163 N-terminal HTH domain-containing protein n=3 Tax=Candidatus Marsarchaeota group 1 TaxID=2203770 RepID=A0A2R6A8K6_9ARCH|nr:MAG: hypothetical protein B9Q01_07150 [Candidatus Marsarchaeota G1 archaeon OSP_D]PSN87589.1 MAG: hypothetical protein B9Q00_08390 [Candidatus Marsarchaeota G1 archaeon OSP_C]PSN95877.1 MAG: hypothetical protein B9P99_00755 [Candidatus Marsarchaeota G1 archaeon OSP_B]